jgi:hypothetical protein
MTKEIQYTLDCPFTSYWLKEVLRKCLERDPVDSIADVEILLHLLEGWNEKILG